MQSMRSRRLAMILFAAVCELASHLFIHLFVLLLCVVIVEEDICSDSTSRLVPRERRKTDMDRRFQSPLCLVLCPIFFNES